MFERILEQSRRHERGLVRFLRDLIAIRSLSAQEGDVIRRVEAEMQACGYDEVRIDAMGNILGRIGSGPRVLALDAHVDTVDVGNPANWAVDPFQGAERDGVVYGRGACDMKGALASIVYGGRIIKELGLEGDVTLWVVGSVQEEDCDGLCWQYILREDGLKPEAVVIAEPTNLGIYRGHRGRMEIEVRTQGVSCHGSAPGARHQRRVPDGADRGRHRAAERAARRRALPRQRHGHHRRDSVHVAVAVRRRRLGDHSPRQAPGGHRHARVRRARNRGSAGRAGGGRHGDRARLRGAQLAGPDVSDPQVLPDVAAAGGPPAAARPATATFTRLFGDAPAVGRWVFSTNGVAVMGMHGIPCIGFGPGDEVFAHMATEQIPVEHLVKAAAWYAAFPGVYAAVATPLQPSGGPIAAPGSPSG